MEILTYLLIVFFGSIVGGLFFAVLLGAWLFVLMKVLDFFLVYLPKKLRSL